MSSTRNTSTLSQIDNVLTPRRLRSRKTTSLGSPALSNVSGRQASVAEDTKKNQGSFVLSPLANKKSILTDNTCIDHPGRQSWWKQLGENSRDVIEVLNTDAPADTKNVVDDYDVLSQEKKSYTIDLPESSDNESINSIVVPQRRLFIQQPTQSHNNFHKIIGNRDSLAKINKTNNELQDKTLKVKTKNLFNFAPKRTRPAFPEALLKITPNKTANKTKEMVQTEVKGQVRTLFGNKPGIKRKNMFIDFIMSESEDEIPDIQPRVFGFPKKTDARRASSASRGTRDPSPTSSITTDIEMDDWKLLPSSTMVENQIEETIADGKPVKKARLSKLPEANKDSNVTNNKSRISNKSKVASDENSAKQFAPSSKIDNVIDEMMADTTPARNTRSSKIPEAETSKNLTFDKIKSLISNKSLVNQVNKSNTVLENQTDVVQKDYSVQQKEINEIDNIGGEQSIAELENREKQNNVSEKSIQPESRPSLEKGNNCQNDLEIGNNEYPEISHSKDTTKEAEDEQTEIENIELILKHDGDKTKDKNKSLTSNKSLVKVTFVTALKKSNNVLENQTDATQKDHSVLQTEINKIDKKGREQSVAELENSEKQNNMSAKSVQRENQPSLEKDNDSQNDMEIGNNKDPEVGRTEATIKEAEDEQSENENNELSLKYDEYEQSGEEDNEQDEDDNVMVENNESEQSHEEENEDEQEVSIVESNRSEDVEQESEINEKINESTVEQSIEEEEDFNQNVSEEVNQTGEDLNEQSVAEDVVENDNDRSVAEDEVEYDNDRSVAEDEVENDNDRSVAEDEVENDNDRSVAEDEVEDDNEQNSSQEEEVQESEPNFATTQNKTHDTTGRYRNKKDYEQSPEVILQNRADKENSFTVKGRNTSIRKTKSMIKQLSIKASLAPARDSTGFNDGTTNSSAEGSGWDSHRTTRKTIRQTMGKDFSIRKSLRALVMEKSAKRHTAVGDLNEDHARIPLANSTQYHEAPPVNEDEDEEFDSTETPVHEMSTRTRQATLETHLQSIQKKNHQKRLQIEAEVKNALTNPSNENMNYFKVPLKPGFSLKHKLNGKTQHNKPKAKVIKSNIIPLENLPVNLLEDMKYKPPKRYKPGNASWITKRLYHFLESKLEAKYDYKARVRAEKLVETLYTFTKDLRRHPVAPKSATDVLKQEMARLNIVQTHFDFYNFFHEYMPREVRVKVVPDLANKLSVPKHGVFMDILK